MIAERATAIECYSSSIDSFGNIVGKTSSFICPYAACGVFAVHHWGTASGLQYYLTINSISNRNIGKTKVVCARCEACDREVVFVNGQMVMPESSEAPPPSSDLPPELLNDYIEAARILTLSPRGSAALLRLIVQKLLPHIGATPNDINKMIGELVTKGVISPSIQKALDSVRVIGNEAIHPGVIDLTDDSATATSLFRLINFIVEKAITDPAAVESIYAGLPPAKLAGIEQRDGTTPA